MGHVVAHARLLAEIRTGVLSWAGGIEYDLPNRCLRVFWH